MSSPRDVVVIDAVRSAIGRRNGALSKVPATELLASVLKGLMERVDLDPREVGHVVGGNVNQVGNQAGNVTRNGWLMAGLPLEVPAVTVNTQCGSSQEALTLAHSLVASGLTDVAVACGVETMSQIPMGANVPTDPYYGEPRGGSYTDFYESTTQFEGAERIAEEWGLSREDLDRYGVRSQELARKAWEEGRFETQIVPIQVAVDGEGESGATRTFARDEGLRETTLEALGTLRVNPRQADGPSLHTAGTSSQISDAASACLLVAASRLDALGLTGRARLVDSVLVGSDPVLMLTGPIPATTSLLERSDLKLDEIDLFEINEAFASVVLAWCRETGAPMERVNPNGGAIALGHPLGASGVILATKAIHELTRTGKRYGLVSMCCGGGLGTGTIVERI